MSDAAKTEKSLSMPMLISCIVVYLTIIQGMALLLTTGQEVEYATFPTTESIIRGVTIPAGLALVFLAFIITWLGWWKRVLYERVRLARWAWIVPALMVLSIIVVTNYQQLGAVNSILPLALLGSVLLIGIGEELMFRGITLETIRENGQPTELKAALWTAIIFGLAHISNVFIEGPSALIQAAVATTSGMFYYIALRVSGSLVVPIILHAAWDFSLFSGRIGLDPEPSDFVLIAFLTILILTIVLVVRWRAIWPPAIPD